MRAVLASLVAGALCIGLARYGSAELVKGSVPLNSGIFDKVGDAECRLIYLGPRMEYDVHDDDLGRRKGS